MPVTGKPSPFRISGGRAGTIVYEQGDEVAELSWEMLVGNVEMVIHAAACQWTAPALRPMGADEVIALARRLASALPGRIEVALDGGSQIVDPE